MRIRNSIKNMTYSYLFLIPQMLLSFVLRYLFIRYLSVEYLGANSLFSNVLSVLSFADLGIGSAITYSLYKPLASNDEYTIRALVNLYRKCYLIISIIIFISGIAVLPFLPAITNYSTLPNISFLFLLNLINVIVGYLNADKQSLIMADQKRYIVTGYRSLFLIIQYIVQIIIIIETRNYVLFLVVQIIIQITQLLSIRKYAYKHYPYLKIETKTMIDDKDKKIILRNTKAMFFHQIGNILVDNTDNIIVSSVLGLSVVGGYSNYLLFINSINLVISQIGYATQASIGNLEAELDDIEYKYKIYKRLEFMNFIIYGGISLFLFGLLNLFVEILSGKGDYSYYLLAVIIVNFFINGLRVTTNQFRNASGAFWYDRYKPIIESILNLTLSILFVKCLGLFGVILATIICRLTVTCPFEQYVVFKHVFKKNMLNHYLVFVFRIVILLMIGYLIYNISLVIMLQVWIKSIIIFTICFIIVFVLLMLHLKMDEFQYFVYFFKSIITKFMENRYK